MEIKTRAKLRKMGIDTSNMSRTTVLTHAFKEIIKYSGASIASKSAEKADSGSTKAPTMTNWPAEAWREWFIANRGFRSTRSYGILYDPPGYRWSEATTQEKMDWIASAGLNYDKVDFNWRTKENGLSKDDRASIRKIMSGHEVLI